MVERPLAGNKLVSYSSIFIDGELTIDEELSIQEAITENTNDVIKTYTIMEEVDVENINFEDSTHIVRANFGSVTLLDNILKFNEVLRLARKDDNSIKKISPTRQMVEATPAEGKVGNLPRPLADVGIVINTDEMFEQMVPNEKIERRVKSKIVKQRGFDESIVLDDGDEDRIALNIDDNILYVALPKLVDANLLNAVKLGINEAKDIKPKTDKIIVRSVID